MALKILLAVDDPGFVAVLSYIIELEGIEVVAVGDKQELLRQIAETKPHLILLTESFAEGAGLELCREIRVGVHAPYTFPIMMLGTQERESGTENALEAGADDYMLKPFGLRELMARLFALLRRGVPESEAEKSHREEGSFTQGNLTLNLVERFISIESSRGRRIVNLRLMECVVLLYLMCQEGRPVSIETLCERLWGIAPAEQTEHNKLAVKQQIKHLRRKIEIEPGHARYIQTVPHVGYKFCK